MRLPRLFGRKGREHELDEEIQSHLNIAQRDRIARGEDPEAAGRAARREFGNRTLIRETTRAMWSWSSIETLGQDLLYAFRGLRRDPGFTAAAALTVALGIGANTAIFSLLDAMMLRMLPVKEPGRLVELLFKAPTQNHFNAFSWRSYEHYREHNHVFSDLVAIAGASFSVRGDGLEPERVQGRYVTPNYFAALGVNPASGRLFAAQDDARGAPTNLAVVSWSFWENHFQPNPAIVGRQLVVDGTPVTIVGVAPRGFSGVEPGSRQDIWLPLTADTPRSIHTSSRAYLLKLVARLKPGVTMEQARADMRVLYRWTQEDEYQVNNDRTVFNWKIEVQRAGTGLSFVRDQFANPALILMGAVGLLLLVACASVAGLLVARGMARSREMAVRVSLGASRIRLLRQVFSESLLLAAVAGVLGVIFAYIGTGALVRIIESGREHIQLSVRPDLKVLLFAAGIAMWTGILFGLIPALRAFRAAPVVSLRESRNAGRSFAGKCLVATQVAFSVVLLSGASLFVGRLSELERVNLGFRRDHILLAPLDPSNSGYSGEALARANRDLLARLETIPGVRSATITAIYPLSGVGATRTATVEGYQAQPGERRFLSENWVAPGYFETLGIPLLLGRDFRFEDEDRVVIVSQTLARYFFGNRNPVGKHIIFDGDSRPFEIVGVVGDTASIEAREKRLRFVYFNMFQLKRNFSLFAIRTTADPAAVAGAVRRAVRESMKTVAVGPMLTMGDQVDSSMVPERLLALLSGLFGTLGPVLAALGLYGLLAFTVARRFNEIGIRMALGARPWDIVRTVAGEAFGTVCAGLVAGVPLAYWGIRLAASRIPGLPGKDLSAAAFGAALMIAVALLAACVPARRAARVAPMEALRWE